MSSSNNGTNRIVPIETIESGISSNLKIGNQIVRKTEPAFVRQISDTTDSIHYVSWIFGILLTCTSLLSILIVPWHNVLKESIYLYEIYVYLYGFFQIINL